MTAQRVKGPNAEPDVRPAWTASRWTTCSWTPASSGCTRLSGRAGARRGRAGPGRADPGADPPGPTGWCCCPRPRRASGGSATTGTAARPSPTPCERSARPRLAGPVPAGFAATSVTRVSPDEAFVLGTAPCAHAPCTSIARTLNRGVTWTVLPVPPDPVGAPGQRGVVWGIRFATPEHGFAFGDGLWETTDGGARWDRVRTPNGMVLSLAVVPGRCSRSSPSAAGCSTPAAPESPGGS
jgi:hypothetical protein